MAQNKIDFEALARELAARAEELVSNWLPAGKRRGHEWLVGNLAGEPGESLSINLNTGKWCDFASGEKGGDLISLYAAIHRISQGKAARALGTGRSSIGSTPDNPGGEKIAPRGSGAGKRDSQEPKPWNVLLPVPADAPPPPEVRAFELSPKKWTKLEPVARWAYRDAAGRVLGYVCRFNLPDGSKEVIPLVYCQEASGDKRKWIWKSLPAPRPLYNLPELSQRPEAQVLLVEGEKAADAARTLLPGYVVITWPGGGKAIDQADWSPLVGRKLVLWPDADNSHTYPKGHGRAGEVMDYRDQPGPATMHKIAAKLHGKASELRVLDVRDVAVDGWDAADALAEGWTEKHTIAWARTRVRPYETAGVVDLADFKTAKRRERKPDEAERTPPVSQYGLWEELGLDLNERGAPVTNLSNVLKIFERHPHVKDLIHYDEFYQRYLHRDGREWQEVDELTLATWIQRECRFRTCNPLLVHQAAMVAARWNVTNEPRDWIESLAWDGTPRLDLFFTDALGARDSEYTRRASRNFWLGMVARVFRPGCRLRHVVVLEGAQNKGKSFALAKIGGRWYAEASESVMSKDFYLMLQGKFLIEIAELDAFSRADIRRIKQIISSPTDRFRAPYARTAQDYPRQCVFAGTTNEDAYLSDVTGGTRFWPIPTGEIRLDLIEDNREQLFAEARLAVDAGESWWHMPGEATRKAQESRRQHDEWEDVIADYLIGRDEVRLQDVMVEALKIDIAKQDRVAQLRAANAMRVCGFRREVAWRTGTRRLWVRAHDPD